MVALVGAVATPPPPPPGTPTRPYPASSLTFLCAEISTTLARLASRQRAKKSPIFVLILLSLEGKLGATVFQVWKSLNPTTVPTLSCRQVRAR
jgi:hypothetical protein